MYVCMYIEHIFLLRKLCRHLWRHFFHERLMAVSMNPADPTAAPATYSPKRLNVIAVLAVLNSNPSKNLRGVLYQLGYSG